MIEEARATWESGNIAKTGYLIFESLTNDQRPLWAANILELCCEFIPKIPEVTHIMNIARNPINWNQGRAAFHSLRKRCIQENLAKENLLFSIILSIAEKTAKVTYNAAINHNDFDADSGWILVTELHQVIDLLSNPEFEEQAWEILIEPF